MRKLATLGVLLASLSLFAGVAFAYSSPGSPSGYVNDFAQVLSAEAKQSLEAELTAFKQSTSNEITVVLVPNMGGDYIENYAVKLFAEWGIGTKDKDNGVLLLLSIEERKMRIEVGYGLEGALPDSIAQSILINEMTPLLKAGDYDGAVTAGVHAIEQAARGEYTASAVPADNPFTAFFSENFDFVFIAGFFVLQFLASILARSRSWWAGGVVGLLGGLGIGWVFALAGLFIFIPVVLMTAFGLLFDYIVSNGYRKAKANGTVVPWWFGGSGGRGGGSGGGGFGGFGGGGSGGGGASGSW